MSVSKRIPPCLGTPPPSTDVPSTPYSNDRKRVVQTSPPSSTPTFESLAEGLRDYKNSVEGTTGLD